MTVELRAVCDACGCGGPILDAGWNDAEAAVGASGLEDGGEFSLAHVHPQCAADLRRGIDPALSYGLPGLATP
jgi:hypothetical protein